MICGYVHNSQRWLGNYDLSVNFEVFVKGKMKEETHLRSRIPTPWVTRADPGAKDQPPPVLSACTISREPICNLLVHLGLHRRTIN